MTKFKHRLDLLRSGGSQAGFVYAIYLDMDHPIWEGDTLSDAILAIKWYAKGMTGSMHGHLLPIELRTGEALPAGAELVLVAKWGHQIKITGILRTRDETKNQAEALANQQRQAKLRAKRWAKAKGLFADIAILETKGLAP